MNPFPVEIRTAAFVPRWSIVWNAIPDNVAQHSFYVALYAYMIADCIDWQGPRDLVMFDALMHDADEVITGDIVGPVKSRIVDEDRMGSLLDEYVDSKLEGMQVAWEEISTKHVKWTKDAQRIVSAADKLDALLFLIVNRRLGNQALDPIINSATDGLEGSWQLLPVKKEVRDETWATLVLPAIARHCSQGGHGL